MKVSQLIAQLSVFDPNMDVAIAGFNPCKDDMDTYHIEAIKVEMDADGNRIIVVS
jgi:hypothetical protein